MKLNYRDKVILLAFLSVLVVVAAIFGLIRPKANKIEEDEAALAKVEKEWQEADSKIQAIPGLQDVINKSYDDSKKLSDDFIDRTLIDEPYEFDKYMQEYVDKCNGDGKIFEAQSVELGSQSTTAIDYYYFTPGVLTSTMFDAADINGNYQAEIDEQLAKSNALSQRTKETIVKTQYGISVNANKEGIWEFLKTINDMKTSIIIDSVSISDYSFGEDSATPETPSDGTSQATFVVSLYSVFPMDKPVVD